MMDKVFAVLAGVVVCTLALPVPSGRCCSCISQWRWRKLNTLVLVVDVVVVVAFFSRARILGECSTIHSALFF